MLGCVMPFITVLFCPVLYMLCLHDVLSMTYCICYADPSFELLQTCAVLASMCAVAASVPWLLLEPHA